MHMIGVLTLNFSFLLYILFYLPQLWHNFRYQYITELSLWFHALLLIASIADLYYGFGRIEQWQYRAVSILMFLCLLVQHVHLGYCMRKKIFSAYWLGYSLLSVAAIVALILIYILLHLAVFSQQGPIISGWIERCCYWFYILPQLYKNIQLRAARSVNVLFVLIGLITAICDTVSAWVFHWGAPSLYGTPIAIVIHSILLSQIYYYNNRNKLKYMTTAALL